MIGKRHEYEAMATCERQLWWYRCLHDLTLRTIQKSNFGQQAKILDAGCGTGGLLLYLKENGFSGAAGFDLSADAVMYAQQAVDADIRLLDITRTAHSYPENYFDIVISHDILCLLPDGAENTAIAQLLTVVKPGGLLLMNLPALESFRGTHDIAVNIQKRYSLKAIRQLVNGLAQIEETVYWPFFLSPLIFFVRSVQKVKTHFINTKEVVSDVKMQPAFINRLFYKITKLENRLLTAKPWGSSLFIVLRKAPGPAGGGENH